MTKELRKVIEKVIELSKKSTLCADYRNESICLSFKIDGELQLTENTTGLGDVNISIWSFNESICTPNQIILRTKDIKSFEFITEDEMRKRSNGECNMAALEIKFADGAELTIFEDVA